MQPGDRPQMFSFEYGKLPDDMKRFQWIHFNEEEYSWKEIHWRVFIDHSSICFDMPENAVYFVYANLMFQWKVPHQLDRLTVSYYKIVLRDWQFFWAESVAFVFLIYSDLELLFVPTNGTLLVKSLTKNGHIVNGSHIVSLPDKIKTW